METIDLSALSIEDLRAKYAAIQQRMENVRAKRTTDPAAAAEWVNASMEKQKLKDEFRNRGRAIRVQADHPPSGMPGQRMSLREQKGIFVHAIQTDKGFRKQIRELLKGTEDQDKD